jgi:hypothetical protein
MASVPIEIDGVFYPHARHMSPVKGTMVGQAAIIGLGVGGGPMPPQRPVDPGYSPPWAQEPVDPGYSPPWARPPGGHPEHPIVKPEPPDPPEVPPGTPPNTVVKSPEAGSWGIYTDADGGPYYAYRTVKQPK